MTTSASFALVIILGSMAAMGCDDDPYSSPSPTGSSGSTGSGSGGSGSSNTGGSGNPDTTPPKTVGDEGTFVKTFDEANWSVSRPSLSDLFDVTCVSSRSAWTVGANGTILHTEDGGASWTPQASPVQVHLRSVRFADRNIGWAVGDTGTVIATRDGGQHWETQSSNTRVTLHGVAAAADGLTAWAVGDSGTLLRTGDGGSSWLPLSIPTVGHLYDITTGGRTHGWIVGEQGTILELEDSSVVLLPAVTRATLRAVDVPDLGWGYAAGGFSVVAVGDVGTVLALGPGDIQFRQLDTGTNANLKAALVATTSNHLAYVAGERGTLLRSAAPELRFEVVPTHTTRTLRAIEDF